MIESSLAALKKKEEADLSADDVSEVKPQDPRPDSILIDLIAQAKAAAANPSAIKSNSNEMEFAQYAFKNKDKVQSVAVSRLEALEEIVNDFNDSYHSSKKAAIEEVLSKEDYLDDLKQNLLAFASSDIEKSTDSSTPSVRKNAKDQIPQ